MPFASFSVFTLPVFGGLESSLRGLRSSSRAALLNGNSGDNSLMNGLIDTGGVVIDRYRRTIIDDGGDRSGGSDVGVEEWYLELLPHTR